jgi:hypothetical protein
MRKASSQNCYGRLECESNERPTSIIWYDNIQLYPFADRCMDMLYDDEFQFELGV